MVLLQCEIPQSVNLEVAQLCKAANVPVILDAGGSDEALAPELLACIGTLSPNETELARLTGLPTGTTADVVLAASQLLRQGASSVLVKRGTQGSLLLQGNTPLIHKNALVYRYFTSQTVDLSFSMTF